MGEHELFKIIDIKEEREDVRTFAFDKEVEGMPGQYVMAWIPGISENPFSVAQDEPLYLTIQKKWDFTEAMFENQKGDEVYIRGPYGTSFLDFTYNDSAKQIIVGGGTGIIPLAFLSDVFPYGASDAYLGFTTRDDIFLTKRFQDPKIIVEDENILYNKGKVTDLLKGVELGSNDSVYICGPRPMILSTIDLIKDNISHDRIIYSLENEMRCGYGVCGQCHEQGYSVCRDGPVFSYDKLKLRE